MMDLFHSFDDTNSGVLKKVLGIHVNLSPKKTKEEQETKVTGKMLVPLGGTLAV